MYECMNECTHVYTIIMHTAVADTKDVHVSSNSQLAISSFKSHLYAACKMFNSLLKISTFMTLHV